MKYQAIINKLQAKEKSLLKAKKELVPLQISLTRKSFEELQNDIVINLKNEAEDYKLKETTDSNVFTIKHYSTGVTGIITID